MKLFITLLENVNKSRTSAGNLSLSRGVIGCAFEIERSALNGRHSGRFGGDWWERESLTSL
jgi:hypothetical protein